MSVSYFVSIRAPLAGRDDEGGNGPDEADVSIRAPLAGRDAPTLSR